MNSETKIVSLLEVNKNEKLESVIISKMHSDMIYNCPNCNKDLMILISTPEDNNDEFQISLIVVDQIEKSIEKANQTSEDIMELVNVCTHKSSTEDELHELPFNHNIVNKNTTNDNERDIKSIQENLQKDTNHTNSHITLKKTNILHESNKGTKRKFQENVSTKTAVNPSKLQKLEVKDVKKQEADELYDSDTSSMAGLITFHSINNGIECPSEETENEAENSTTERKLLNKNLTKLETKLDAREQDQSNNDNDEPNIADLITFQLENNESVIECISNVVEVREDDTTDMTKTKIECINQDDINDIDIPKSNIRHICDLCGARYISQEKYEFHMERHKLNKIDKYICIICDKESKNENLLWDHYLHTHKSPMRYICLDCDRIFMKKPNLKEHQKRHIHSGYKMLNVEIDTVNDQTQKVITKQTQKCTVCRKVIKDIDPNAINDLATCASCEDSSACLIVDGEAAKVISQRQYHCLKCRKHFMRQERLEFHEMRHNENMDEFICSTCGKEFSGENSLYEHYLFVHKGARPHVCEVCGKSFQLKARLKEHHRKHTGEKPYQCETCGLRCMTTHALKFHKKSHLSLRHACDLCGKSFIKKQNLNEHLEKHWKKDKNILLPQIFTCSVCKYELPTFRMLKHHMVGSHMLDRQDPLIMKEKPLYECDECQEKFKHQMSLKAHKEKVHEGKIMPRIFQCDVCKAVYKVKQKLINHIKSKHSDEKRYKCAQCKMRFTDIKTLYHHVLLHTGRKPFTCEYCNISFRRRDSRDIHRRKHTNDRPYQCTDCNSSFGSYTSRSNHRKKVHGDNETDCPDCGEKCSDIQEIRIHLNKHLGEKLSELEST